VRKKVPRNHHHKHLNLCVCERKKEGSSQEVETLHIKKIFCALSNFAHPFAINKCTAGVKSEEEEEENFLFPEWKLWLN
jgi:hypothetical protein